MTADDALGCRLAAHRLELRHGAAVASALEACGGDPRVLLADPPVALRAAVAGLDWNAVDADREWLARPGCAVLERGSPGYPECLGDLHDPPLLLFVRGDCAALALPQIAVVGSRNPTAGGVATARDFAATLTRRGLAIASGLATGIDGAAHHGAVGAGGTTIAVLGSGPDVVYPRVHRELAAAIAEAGALVTEFPPGTGARRSHFPRRNRLIAGLALGVLVVEAGARSGALITARLAAELGREVFAIPGSIHNPLARGCHRLIRDGAKLVESVDDVLVEIAPAIRALIEPAAGAGDAAHDRARDPRDADEAAVLDALGHDPVSFDRLAQRSGLTAGTLSSILLRLEMHGLVRTSPGACYVRVPAKG